MSDFERIKNALETFRTEIEQWDLDGLSDDEFEEVTDLIEQTVILLAGSEDEGDTDEDEDLDIE